ncbi:unnamed protein product [Amoebophrya sp. A25]|nr:unnamed protein product [Amoebophrya sp. A25]|eukprot:GSA25T00001934001.1
MPRLCPRGIARRRGQTRPALQVRKQNQKSNQRGQQATKKKQVAHEQLSGNEKPSPIADKPLRHYNVIRLFRRGWVWLYHATSSKRASGIILNKRFLPGVDGSLGGNIYFSTRRAAAVRRQRAVENLEKVEVLVVKVWLRRVAEVEQGTRVDGRLLGNEGCDSAREFGNDVYCIPGDSWMNINMKSLDNLSYPNSNRRWWRW